METRLTQKLKYIYENCHNLLHLVIGAQLDVAGNIAIFSQSEAEYAELSQIARKLTKPLLNPNQKYFELIDPITLHDSAKNTTATFTYLFYTLESMTLLHTVKIWEILTLSLMQKNISS